MEFGEDGFGALRPDERFRGLVVLADEAGDGFLQFGCGCPLNVLLQTVAIADDGGQSRAVLGSDDDAHGLCHAASFAWPAGFVDPLIASVH